MNRQFKWFFLTVIALFTAFNSYGQTADSLAINFKNPPTGTKPWVYWYWISDHISKEGITKDLEAMAKVGIGEALIGNIDEIKQKGNVKALTEEWFQMVEFAIREGKRLGVNIGLFNSPGWSQSGGPWNKPENAMRYLTMSEVRVKGPLKYSGKLTQPTPQFQDVALMAFAVPIHDADNLSALSSKISSQPEIKDVTNWFDANLSTEVYLPVSPTKSVSLDFAQSTTYTARSLTLYPSHTSFSAKCEVQSLQDDGSFKTIKSFKIERTNNSTSLGFLPFAPICETFASISSKHFRLIFININGNAGFTEIVLSGAARAERFAEKQLAKLWPTPTPLWDAYMWPASAEIDNSSLAVNPEKVLNISSKLKSDGTLEWDVPAGEWIIQRIGMTPTGQKNAPASVEATGLEVDKMNREWVAAHFEAYIGKIINRLPANDRTALKHIVADSYETGAQNWTDNLANDFQKRYGYDPLPYLPVIFGRLVGNAGLSDRFLWDLRRLIADRISYQYVGGLREKSNEYGLKLWLENYGHWGYPGEFLQYGGQSDEISGEFWTGDEPEGLELRAASSAAHGYGKNIVHAEAFTSGGPMWNWEPWSLKKRGDWAATKGINHFVMHVYIHQPYEEKIPGINAWFGVEFNRHNTWFYQSKEWIDYMRRTHYLLQQGKYVAEVAYFTAEDAPKMTGIRDPKLPEGYNFDYVNAEVIATMTVKNGCFVLPDGMTYRVLVLPPQSTMRPAVLKKLKELIAAGGIVVGSAPEQSPSLENYPLCDLEVRNMAKEIWQNCDGKIVKKVRFGKGTVYNGANLTTVFNDLQISADLGTMDLTHLAWIHRSAPGTEIYYISNQTDETVQTSPSFRVSGLQPELWNPVTAEYRELPDYKLKKGKTIVPLEFAPRESYFVVFRKKIATPIKNQINFVRKKTIGELGGAWTVYFDKKWGAPDSVIFEKLEDWTKRSEAGIKYYSGTARYRKIFDAPQYSNNAPVFLNLGAFNALAVVKLNGESLGLVWAEPHQVDISKFIKAKANVLEIEVTNTWNNLLVGDAASPAEKRLTNATTSPDTNAPLMQSGLLGPVTFEVLPNIKQD
ncbi:MAG: glycosyl hydrolase [Bacteroidales bacterium]|nr:glycosyl hydrolase [Bacteroidales bacterium]